MTPTIIPIPGAPSALEPAHRGHATRAGITGENIICAIIDALQSPDRYRLVACGGELFLQAVRNT